MRFDFDEVVERKGTDSLKFDGLQSRWGRDDLRPMWVADMDFRTPSFVIDAVRKRCEHEVLGYTMKPDCYYEAICNWTQKRYNWIVTREQIDFSPGVVPGLAFSINSFSKPGDRVMIQPPVYPPFHNLTLNLKRTLVKAPLCIVDGKMEFDRADFLEKVKDTKLFIFCNPHNPGGKVWTLEELEFIADACYEAGCLVISDEIHADLTLSGHHHIPFATVSEKARMNSVTYMAPSKSFNMAGLASAYSIIPSEEIRRRYRLFVEGNELNQGNVFSFLPVVAAYTQGEAWLSEMLTYIEGNIDFVESFLQQEIPQITMIRPQASFLIFLDCRGLSLSQKELVRLFVDEAGLALNDGQTFGEEGVGFMRLNIGCPRSEICHALTALKEAVGRAINS